MKAWLSDFPGHNASVAIALALIGLTGLIVCLRLGLGLVFPDGYDGWLMLLGALAGVNVAGLGIKRATDFRYKAAGTAAVNVEGPSNVTVETSPKAAKPEDRPVLTREVAEQAAAAYAGAADPDVHRDDERDG